MASNHAQFLYITGAKLSDDPKTKNISATNAAAEENKYYSKFTPITFGNITLAAAETAFISFRGQIENRLWQMGFRDVLVGGETEILFHIRATWWDERVDITISEANLLDWVNTPSAFYPQMFGAVLIYPPMPVGWMPQNPLSALLRKIHRTHPLDIVGTSAPEFRTSKTKLIDISEPYNRAIDLSSKG